MANILIMVPTAIANIGASRGDGIANLLRPDPREIWQDSAVGSAAVIDIDLGSPQVIDTVYLGCVWWATWGATWAISGGLSAADEVMMSPMTTLRVPERAGRTSAFSHAFWTGAEAYIRHLRITIMQTDGERPIAVGALMAGQAWQPNWNMEIGSGRAVKDTGSITRLPSGGVSIVEGARFGSFKFTLGVLTDDEVDYLYDLQLDRGETRRLLVVEDPARTAGLRSRLHYGALTSLRAFERRDPAQTKWEATVEDWVAEGNALVTTQPVPLLTLSGQPISFGGDILTIGN